MSKKLCVYTCITGNYDNLHEIEHPEKNIDYYCFTNNKHLKSKTWQIIQIKDDKLDNVRLARKIKILGHPIINEKYEITVWSDADVIWQKSISDFVQEYFKNNTLAIFKHHARDNIFDEAIACLRLRKDNKEIIQKVLNYYQSVGYPDNNGLCESTVFIKNIKNPQVTETMQIWFDMVKNFSRRDQLSFNYAAWKTDLKIDYIPIKVWDNPWFYTAKHTPNQEIKDCHVYYGNPDQDFDFEKYQTYLYQTKNDAYQFTTTIPYDIKVIEFNPTNIIGTNFENIAINPTPNSIKTHGAIVINNQKSFFCNEHGTIRAYCDFKKGQKLSFSITMEAPDTAIFNKIIEYQWLENDTLSRKASELEAHNKTLQNNLHNVLNSKGWKTLEKFRKILPHK